MQKYDEFIPYVLLRKAFADDYLDLEELKAIEQEFLGAIPFSNVVYCNPSYNLNDNPDRVPIDINDYYYDKAQNAYTHKYKHPKDEELAEQNNPFNNLHLIYKYEKIKPYQINSKSFKINEKSLFEVKCK